MTPISRVSHLCYLDLGSAWLWHLRVGSSWADLAIFAQTPFLLGSDRG
jgi:hypothetical protein